MKELWCIRIPGGDDIFAKESREAAEAAAAEHNKYLNEWYPTQTELKRELLPTLEQMQAVVEPWPWGGTSHAEDLQDQKRDM